MNKNFDTKFFGMFVKKCRKDMGLSQKELGELIGVSRKMLFRIETGETEPLVSVYFGLMQLFEKRLDDYIDVFFW